MTSSPTSRPPRGAAADSAPDSPTGSAPGSAPDSAVGSGAGAGGPVAEAGAAHPRFASAMRELGLDDLLPRVRRFPEGARTAAQAAAAWGYRPGRSGTGGGCGLSQICKSLVFVASGAAVAGETAPRADEPVLVLMDGASRVDVELVRRELGATKVKQATADLVREATGYAIGGVPPFGHRTATRVLADRSLLAHATVWAAAGTPHTVFPMDPKSLIAHAGGTLVDVREQSA